MKKSIKYVTLVLLILFLCLTIITGINVSRKSQKKKIVATSLRSTTDNLERTQKSRSETNNELAALNNTIGDLEKTQVEIEQQYNSLKNKYPTSKLTAQVKDKIKKLESELSVSQDQLNQKRLDAQKLKLREKSLRQSIEKAVSDRTDMELELKKIEAENKRALLQFLGSVLASLLSAGASIAVAIIGKKKQPEKKTIIQVEL